MTVGWISVGAFGCALAVAMGAFGAHGLKAHLGMDELALWETSARYLMYASLVLLAMGLYSRHPAAAPVAGSAISLAVGAVVFSSTVALLALGGPRWLGAITPLGGFLMIVGLLWFAWSAARVAG